jgi:crotonobetainyl-CoA:carnitine CoA-transferase CaiB-like acyl-CoA transferase
VCEVLGVRALLDDPRFTTPTLRAANQEVLKTLLEPSLGMGDVVDWLARLQAEGVPCAPINAYAEALDDPQATHLQLVKAVTLPGGHATHTVGCPVWLDGAPVEVRTSYPALGEHTAELAGIPEEGQ